MPSQTTTPRVLIHGAAPDAGNLGLNALCSSLVGGLRRAAPHAEFSVLTYGGAVPSGEAGDVEFIPAFRTKRVHKPESLVRIRVSSKFGGLGNLAARRFREATAFLDASGGDSFTDLYGMGRFWGMVRPKQIAMENGVPLILLPQTYGPFRSKRAHATAVGILRAAQGVWTRDQRNYGTLRELLGDAFDPSRHRAGVDLAFALDAEAPAESELGEAGTMLLETGEGPLVGLNVSGLLYNDPSAARDRYRFQADYRRVITETATRLIRDLGARVLLVPHVVPRHETLDDDRRACDAVRDELKSTCGDRIASLPTGLDARRTKWCIARTEWFCGTRMHSAIAALGSGVPASAIAYSRKTLGVFETCGQGDQVADPRRLGTDDVIEHLLESFATRHLVGARLAQHLPSVLRQAEDQIDEIAAMSGIASGRPVLQAA